MNIMEYGQVRAVDRTRTLFGQVMRYFAATAGLFALGAYLGRNVGYGVAIVCYLLAVACLIGMRFAVLDSRWSTPSGCVDRPTWTRRRSSLPRSSWTC